MNCLFFFKFFPDAKLNPWLAEQQVSVLVITLLQLPKYAVPIYIMFNFETKICIFLFTDPHFQMGE